MDDPARTPQPAAAMTSARARRRGMRTVLDAAAASLANCRDRSTPAEADLPEELSRRLGAARRFRARADRRPPPGFWAHAAADADRPHQAAQALAEAATLRRLGAERAAAMIGAQASASVILKEIDGRVVDALRQALGEDPRHWALSPSGARPAPKPPAPPTAADPTRRGAELAEIIRRVGRAALAAWAAEAPRSAAQFARLATGADARADDALAHWTRGAIERADAIDSEASDA